MSYYKDQLEKIETKGEYKPSFKITHPNGETKWMELNMESVKDLREWLDYHYPIQTGNVLIPLEETEI